MLKPGFFLSIPLLSGIVSAEERFARLEITEKDIPAASEDWYGLYDSSGKKMGYCRLVLRPPEEGKPYVECGLLLKAKLVALGEKISIESQEERRFDPRPPYGFQGGRTMQTQNDDVKQIEVSRKEKGFEARITEAGESRTMMLPDPDYRLSDFLGSEIWIRRDKPKPGDRMTFREFGLEDFKHDLETYTVKSVGKKVAEGVSITVYEVALHTSLSGDLGLFRHDGEGRVLSGKIGGLLEMRLEPAKKARRIEESSDLFLATTIKVDKPLGDPEEITELTLEAVGSGVEKLKAGPRQSVEREEGKDTCIIKTGARHGSKVVASAEEIQESLKESPHHPIRSSRILDLLKEAVGDAPRPRERVRRLSRFVSDFIQDDYAAEPLTVLDILKKRKGDCTEHALLFTTLARAAGIPAREVAGLVYMGDGERGFGGHAWNEVVLDGEWVPVDATFDETEVNATHIRYGDDDQSLGVVIATAGNIRFKVKEVKRKD